MDLEDLLEEISTLGKVKVNSQGLISFDNFMAIVRLIAKHSKLILLN